MYVYNNNVTYFDSFGVEHIPKEIRTFINNKNIKTNIFKIQEYDLIMCGYFCIRFIDFILAGKKFWLIILICFLLMILIKNMIWFLLISKMNESNSFKAIDKTNLSEQTKFRLYEIIGIENYFHQEINQKKSYRKKLSKYITAFDYIDKILIILSERTGGVSIIS